MTPSSDRGERSATGVTVETRLQFDRFGHVVVDQYDHQHGKPLFNRVTEGG